MFLIIPFSTQNTGIIFTGKILTTSSNYIKRIINFIQPHYAECPSGFYGLGCTTACPGHCKNDESCNHINGTCDRGCKDGWTGVTCAEGNIQNESNFKLE